ncbi:zinc finger protein 521 [Folsomia candida]|uniref:zinc finger protein 521 n=1 Tax=Folsomia candida TaxID=158441 RepID=UPI000B907FF0|nr:zinc finger protein 521 [Folsomia candida]
MQNMEIFQCQLCPVMFETYVLAACHLRTQHGLTVRTGSRCKRHDKLQKLTLPQLSVSIPRMVDNFGKVTEQNDDQEVSHIVPIQTNTKKPRKSFHTVAKTKKGVEIKLDSLKASEIDTLMQDLYQNKNPKKLPEGSASSEETIPSSSRNRNNRRAAATAAYKGFVKMGEDDDEALDNRYEEPPNVRIKRKPAAARFDDIDYRPYNYGGNKSGGVKKNINDATCDLDPIRSKRRRGSRTNNDDNIEKTPLLLFTCSTCPIQFTNKLDFIRHEKNHEKFNNKNHACPLCYLKFAKKTSLQQHFILHLENNPFVCKLSGCGAKFGNYDHLRRHVQLHTGDKPFTCEYCSRKFARNDSLQKHLNSMHLNKVHRKWRHRNPRKTFSRVKPVTALAPQAFLQDATGTVIQPTKEEQDEIRLEVGSQHFMDHVVIKEDATTSKEQVESAATLKTETSSNYNISDDEDDDENDSDSDKNNDMPKLTQISSNSNPRRNVRSIILSDPVYLKLLQDNPTAAAEVVPQTDGYSRGYGNGEVRHEFKCTICGWSAARAFFFKQHMKKRHNKDTSLIPSSNSTNTAADNSNVSLLCGSCGYQSISADDLSKHIRKEHKPAKKFSCSFCSIRFNSLDKIAHHEKVYHLSEKKFACSKCPAKFARPLSLQVHEKRTHGPRSLTNLEKCKCKICGSQLGTVLSLRMHMTNVHTSKLRVTCKICLQTCANKHVLKRHLRYVHLNMPNPYNKTLKMQMDEAKVLKKTKQIANSQNPPTGDTASNTSEIQSPPIDDQTTAETDLIIGI